VPRRAFAEYRGPVTEIERTPPAALIGAAARQGWRLPIAVYLAAGFGGLLAAAVGAVLLLSLATARQNTYDLLRQNAEVGISVLIHDIAEHLDPARQQVQLIAALLTDGTVPPDDDARVQDLLLGSIAGLPHVTGVAFVHPDLHAVSAGNTVVEGVRRPTTASESWIYRPEVRLQIRAAGSEHEFKWGEVLYVPSLAGSQLVLRNPVWRGDQFAGVVLGAVSLKELSTMLANSTVRNLSTAFILRGRDKVVADAALPKGPQNVSEAQALPGLADAGDEILAGIWGPETASARAVLGDSLVRGRIVRVKKTDYLFLYRELEDYGASWLVGYYMELEAVSASLERLSLAAIVGGAILVLALLLALALGRALGQPIRRLSAAAGAIRRLEIAAVAPLPGSRFREIHAASEAYNAMLAGLVWFETYVPKTLVMLLIGRGHRGQLASETREITVLFSDIVGFTGIGERLAAPALAEFLNRHFSMLAECIEAEGGTIDKYIGDSVMAFWGAPDLQPDHAARACRAALAIAGRLHDDNQRRTAEGKRPVRLRIGIHTGPVVVGNIGAPGRINYTAIGDTVNISQRLEQLGKQVDDGTGDCVILIGADTARLLPAGDGQPTPLGAFALRGRDAETEVYRLA
jgi:class 3 adenylate cyclase